MTSFASYVESNLPLTDTSDMYKYGVIQGAMFSPHFLLPSANILHIVWLDVVVALPCNVVVAVYLMIIHEATRWLPRRFEDHVIPSWSYDMVM